MVCVLKIYGSLASLYRNTPILIIYLFLIFGIRNMLYCIFNVICKENNAVDTEYFNVYHQIKYLLCKDLIRIEWCSSRLQI